MRRIFGKEEWMRVVCFEYERSRSGVIQSRVHTEPKRDDRGSKNVVRGIRIWHGSPS